MTKPAKGWRKLDNARARRMLLEKGSLESDTEDFNRKTRVTPADRKFGESRQRLDAYLADQRAAQALREVWDKPIPDIKR